MCQLILIKIKTISSPIIYCYHNPLILTPEVIRMRTRITYGTFGFFTGLLNTIYPEDVLQKAEVGFNPDRFNRGVRASLIGVLIPMLVERNANAMQFYLVGVIIGLVVGDIAHSLSGQPDVVRFRP